MVNQEIHRRKIVHIDMDAFFSSVEERDNPELKGKPVVVGGDPNGRGVVATCSYAARKFGIHSAMAARTAQRLCPQAIFLGPRFNVYRSVSKQIMNIFYEYTCVVEPLSLDEAYLDITENRKGIPSPILTTREIMREIRKRTGLTASAGVSFNKFLAKVASGMNKPNGMTIVTPDQAEKFIDELAIGKFFGIGKVTEKRMKSLGINNGKDLRYYDRARLRKIFGKLGEYYHDIACGVDDRQLNPNRIRRSIGKETTLPEDIDDRDDMIEILREISSKVESSLKKHEVKGKTITLKVKYFDFVQITRCSTVNGPVSDANIIMKHIAHLLGRTRAGDKKVRLLGISISNLVDANANGYEQLLLPL